jgi:hypothetical protein
VQEVYTALVRLAGTPDASGEVDALLEALAVGVPVLVEPVDHASVTVRRGTGYATVATSGKLAEAMDLAQYADAKGPCLDALGGMPVGVEDTLTTDGWPRFRSRAFSFGLFASLSVPLFAGSGAVVGALNLYARDPQPMGALISRVVSLFHAEDAAFKPRRPPELDPGGEEFVRGLAAALDVHDDIQAALGIIMGGRQTGAEQAYADLCELAAAAGGSLHDTALTLVQRREAWSET